jgi:putative transposase
VSGYLIERELTQLIAQRGTPGIMVSDKGAVLTCNAVLACIAQVSVQWHWIAPGKPMQIGGVNSFIAECAANF